MDKSGTSSQRPIVLVIENAQQIEKLIEAGLLGCQAQIDFCPADRKHVLHEILVARPTLIIAPLQMKNMNALQLEEEVIKKTGAPIPGIFIQDPSLADIEKLLLELVTHIEFLPKQFQMQDLHQKVAKVAALNPSTKREYRYDRFLTPRERKKSTAA